MHKEYDVKGQGGIFEKLHLFIFAPVTCEDANDGVEDDAMVSHTISTVLVPTRSNDLSRGDVRIWGLNFEHSSL